MSSQNRDTARIIPLFPASPRRPNGWQLVPVTLRALATAGMRLLLRCDAAAQSRHRLTSLTDRELADVGLSRDDVRRAVGDPYWMPPLR